MATQPHLAELAGAERLEQREVRHVDRRKHLLLLLLELLLLRGLVWLWRQRQMREVLRHGSLGGSSSEGRGCGGGGQNGARGNGGALCIRQRSEALGGGAFSAGQRDANGGGEPCDCGKRVAQAVLLREQRRTLLRHKHKRTHLIGNALCK